MSINAINSVSLYEYYYSINKEEERKRKSPLLDEMKKYNITPTDSEEINVALLKRAKLLEKEQETPKETSPSDRPWADLMYQLNIDFNDDPKDDIEDIKEEITKLIADIDDDTLHQEVKDLIDYAQNLYIDFIKNASTPLSSQTLTSQLNNMSMINQINFL